MRSCFTRAFHGSSSSGKAFSPALPFPPQQADQAMLSDQRTQVNCFTTIVPMPWIENSGDRERKRRVRLVIEDMKSGVNYMIYGLTH